MAAGYSNFNIWKWFSSYSSASFFAVTLYASHINILTKNYKYSRLIIKFTETLLLVTFTWCNHQRDVKMITKVIKKLNGAQVLLQKLIVAQHFKKIRFYGTQNRIIVLRRPCHWSPFTARWSHLSSLRSLLILSSHLLHVFPNVFSSDISTKPLNAFLSLTWMLNTYPSHPPWFHHANILGRV